MLAKHNLPEEYLLWNDKWGSPHGRYGSLPISATLASELIRKHGPFAFQANNSTREFEYPWAYEQISRMGSCLAVIDIGGGVSGLQYVLAAGGHNVKTIDPGLKAKGLGFQLDDAFHARLCKEFRSPVQLITETLQDAGLQDNSADVVVSISALEHFSDNDLQAAATHIQRILKPNGSLVLTVDLFLDLIPFCNQQSNQWGRNVNIRTWLHQAGLELVYGNKKELYGFDEFAASNIMCELRNYHIGRYYPCIAQCLIARRR